jgi:hypothetical protein
MATKVPEIEKLGPSNYTDWAADMLAWLGTQQLKRLVLGTQPRPSPATTSAEQTAIDTWDDRAEKAAGWIIMMITPEQKVHIKGLEDDPVGMWKKLKDVHIVKQAGARFNSYDSFFGIRKQEDESLVSLTARIDGAMQKIQSLRPDNFTLANLDDELFCMTMIRSLPEEYNTLVTSLLLKGSLSKDTIIEAFQTEENQRQHRAISESFTPSTQALVTSSSTLHTQTKECDFCGIPGHIIEMCWRFQKAQREEKKATAERRSKKKNGGKQQAQQVESAGNASLNSTSKPNTHNDWNADTGASSHMTFHREWFFNYKSHSVPVRLADHTTIYSAGIGDVEFWPIVKGQKMRPIILTNVLHVPLLQSNLLSVLVLTRQKGFNVWIENGTMHFIRDEKTMFVAEVDNTNTAYLSGSTVDQSTGQPVHSASVSSTLPMDYTLWHRRFAHHNHADIKMMLDNNWVDGVRLDSKHPPDPICEPCLAGKMHANPFPTSDHRASHPLELVHMDVHGPTPVASHEGYRYWSLFKDDHTRLRCAIPLRKKSETFATFLRFKAFAENLFGCKIQTIRDDKGGEYMSKEFDKFCDEHGIQRQHTTRNRPQQNGDAERENCVFGERITTLLMESGLPPQFWFECLAAIIYSLNRCPTSALKGMTPYQAAYKRKPNVSNLRVWGCTAYVHIQKDKRKQFEPRMQKCVFIGYPEGYKGWKFYNPRTRKMIISERAEFDERYFPGLKQLGNPSDYPSFVDLHEPSPALTYSRNPVVQLLDYGGDDDNNNPVPDILQLPPSTPSQSLPSSSSTQPHPATPPLALRRQPRNRQPPGEWWNIRHPSPAVPEESSESEPDQTPISESESGQVNQPPVSESDDELNLFNESVEFAVEVEYANCTHICNVADGSELKNWNDAMSSIYAEEWKKAAQDEYAALLENNTWEIVKLPPGKKPIGCRWVWLIKRKADGSIERFKARLVAQGFSQRPGLDYVEIFAPTFRPASLRLVLAIAAIQDLHLHSLDISSAFLNGELEEEIYMKQPEGYHEGGPDDVCRLFKSIYGLKQAPRQWNKKMHATLRTMGFNRLESDQGLYIYQKDEVRIIMPIWVDDVTLASNSQDAISGVIKQLQSHFKLRDLGPTSYLLGIEITRNRSQRSISLSQRQYIVDILDRFGMADCKPVTTPMEPGLHLTAKMGPSTAEEIAAMKKVPYRNAVGALSYLGETTRPDIRYVNGVLARYCSNPGEAHWKAVKHVLRYLQGTKDKKLVYRPDDGKELFTSFTDADHGGDKSTGRSTGGYLIKFGTGAVSWSSKLQPVVALSTTEAEYIAAVEAGKEIVWMRQLLTEFGIPVKGPSILRIDNQSAISVSKNPEHHGRMKHLDLRYFWLRDQVTLGVITPMFVSTDDMPADLLTKALARVKVDKFRRMMGIEP